MANGTLFPILMDDVYFCNSACLTSFSGVVDDEFAILEEEISEWIRFTNPTLYAKLGELTHASWSLPGDPATSIYPEPHGPTQLELPIRKSVALLTPPTPSSFEEIEEDLVSEHSKERVLDVLDSIVIGNATFTLHEYPSPDDLFCCAWPTCRHEFNVIPADEYFGAVKSTADHARDWDSATYSAVDFYCIECFEHIIQLHSDAQVANEDTNSSHPSSLDGMVEQKDVVEAAEKFHPALKPKDLWKMYYPTEPPFEAGDRSNSKEGLRLRRQKQYEIVRITQAATGDEWRAMSTTDTAEPGSLVVVRPPNLPPYRDRYRKQGREWVDRVPNMKEDCYQDEKGSPIEPRILNLSIFNEGLSCYCREPAEESFMIRCSSDTCMFGLIHLQCADLDQLPMNGDEFLCRYCATEKQACPEAAIDGAEEISHQDVEEFTSCYGEDLEIEDGEQESWSDEDDDMMCDESFTVSTSCFVAVNSPALWSGVLPERGASVVQEESRKE